MFSLIPFVFQSLLFTHGNKCLPRLPHNPICVFRVRVFSCRNQQNAPWGHTHNQVRNIKSGCKARDDLSHLNSNLVGHLVLKGAYRTAGTGKTDSDVQGSVEQNGITPIRMTHDTNSS